MGNTQGSRRSNCRLAQKGSQVFRTTPGEDLLKARGLQLFFQQNVLGSSR